VFRSFRVHLGHPRVLYKKEQSRRACRKSCAGPFKEVAGELVRLWQVQIIDTGFRLKDDVTGQDSLNANSGSKNAEFEGGKRKRKQRALSHVARIPFCKLAAFFRKE